MARKSLREQTIMNNYVFSVLMRDPKRIKPLLEMILGKKIKSIKYREAEKTFQEKFESKGIRLDLYVEDEDGNIYDVEVQTTRHRSLGKRMRYYQGMLDVSIFPAGADYRKMLKSYVIFICNHDPYGKKEFIYTFQNRCDQDYELLMGDEAIKVVVNTKGEIGEISDDLKELLQYFDNQKVTGELSRELDEAVQKLINDEERGTEFMTMQAYGAEQRAEGGYERAVGSVRRWYDSKSTFPISEYAQLIDVTVPEFEEILELIKEHPDWDDEAVSEEVAWY